MSKLYGRVKIDKLGGELEFDLKISWVRKEINDCLSVVLGDIVVGAKVELHQLVSPQPVLGGDVGGEGDHEQTSQSWAVKCVSELFPCGGVSTK